MPPGGEYNLPAGLSSDEQEKEIKRRITLIEQSLDEVHQRTDARPLDEKGLRQALVGHKHAEHLISAVYEHLAKASRAQLVSELAEAQDKALATLLEANPLITSMTLALSEHTPLANGEGFIIDKETTLVSTDNVTAHGVQINAPPGGKGLKRMASVPAHARDTPTQP